MSSSSSTTPAASLATASSSATTTAANATENATALPMTNVLLAQLTALRITVVGYNAVYGADSAAAYARIEPHLDSFVNRLAAHFNLQEEGAWWRLKLVLAALQFLGQDFTISQVVALRLMEHFHPTINNNSQQQQQQQRGTSPPSAQRQQRHLQFQQNQQKLKELQRQQHQQQLNLMRTQQQTQEQELWVKQQQQDHLMEQQLFLRRRGSLGGTSSLTTGTDLTSAAGAAAATLTDHTDNSPSDAHNISPPMTQQHTKAVDLTDSPEMASSSTKKRSHASACQHVDGVPRPVAAAGRKRRHVLRDISKSNTEQAPSVGTGVTDNTTRTKRVKAGSSFQGGSMAIIPSLLSSKLSKLEKDTVLQAHDDWRQTQLATRKSQETVQQARHALEQAEQCHEQKLAAGIQAQAVLQGLVHKHA